tara:strand:+ start:1618 stop:2163 length:546 start_codon:yes stop_codon:yes gene_type:complete
MAAKHILSLEVLHTSNPEVFSIKDTSTYAKNLKIDCPELLITVPGFNQPALIKASRGFDLTVTACALNVQTTGCNSNRAIIPDGLYIIRYQVSPHDKAYVEYNHLRITNIMKQYYDKLCELDITPCVPTSERKKLLDELSDIRVYIDAAVAKVEYCASPQAGLELYNFAKRKLDKITCPTC